MFETKESPEDSFEDFSENSEKDDVDISPKIDNEDENDKFSIRGSEIQCKFNFVSNSKNIEKEPEVKSSKFILFNILKKYPNRFRHKYNKLRRIKWNFKDQV